jgi:DegV family protein with EDD domain
MPVAVATDSTHYLPRALADLQEIHQVSLYVGWEGESQRELEMDGFDAFYERLRTDSELPTTSQPSIGDFLAVWEPLIEAGEDVVSIHLAGGISGTYEAARQAHQLLSERGLGERVEVLDSESGCGGTALLVLAARAAARAGADKDSAVAHVREARKALKIWFCLDTLEYLRRGGRIGAAQAVVGTALKLKPILTFGTEIAPVGRVRTRERAFERMVAYLGELHGRGATDWIVQHAQAPHDAARLVEQGRAIFGFDPLFCTQVGPVLGAHLGAGMLVGGMTRPTFASPES